MVSTFGPPPPSARGVLARRAIQDESLLTDLERIHERSRRKEWRITIRDERARPAPDLVDRNFAATGPDQLWVDRPGRPTTEADDERPDLQPTRSSSDRYIIPG